MPLIADNQRRVSERPVQSCTDDDLSLVPPTKPKSRRSRCNCNDFSEWSWCDWYQTLCS